MIYSNAKRWLLAALATFATLSIRAQEIKILTYNIYHGEKHYAPGTSNIPQIAELINRYQPDIVALQEVDSMTNRTAKFNHGRPVNLVQELATLTGMKGFFGKAIDYSNGGYGDGLLTRFPAQAEVHTLSTPRGGEGRVLITVTHTFSNGRKIIVGGTHLCHQYAENQQQQAIEVSEILAASKLPAIVAGDFNIQDNSAAYKLLSKDFIDAAVAFGKPGYTFPFDKPAIRIDYVFLGKNQGWKVKQLEILKTDASDHMPILVTLELLPEENKSMASKN